MELRDKIKNVLREVYGDFETYLEVKYEQKVVDELYSGDIENKKEWVTYNQVILELKHNLKNMLKVKELQYALTENSEPREACITLIETMIEKNSEIDRLYNKIINF